MNEPLVPCSACRRHVRMTERGCPFCLGDPDVDGFVGRASQLDEWDVVPVGHRRDIGEWQAGATERRETKHAVHLTNDSG